ncbi:MAG: hypothetical protein LBU81_07120 [Methanosarcinales archaeon]|nr:hypothetical protein [Methanosarcinales archaeon]
MTVRTAVTQAFKHILIPFIECCILSSIWAPYLFATDLFSVLSMLKKISDGVDIQMGLADETRIFLFSFIILSLIFNIIIYSVLKIILKKKYNFEMKVFFYSVGFLSCSLLLLIDFRELAERIFGPWRGTS